MPCASIVIVVDSASGFSIEIPGYLVVDNETWLVTDRSCGSSYGQVGERRVHGSPQEGTPTGGPVMVHDQITEGDRVAMRWSVKAVHYGETEGISSPCDGWQRLSRTALAGCLGSRRNRLSLLGATTGASRSGWGG